MNEFRQSSLPERNPITYRKHRREVFWQITLPLAIGAVLILAFAVGVSLGSANEVGRWAEISTIWLIIPALLVCLIFLVVLAALVYGVTWLLGAIPPYAHQAQDIFELINTKVRAVADKVVEPVLRLQGFAAAWQALRKK